MNCEISLLLSTLQRQSGLDPNPVVPVRLYYFHCDLSEILPDHCKKVSYMR